MSQAETAGMSRPIPPGMLRISRQGEEDRVVFPVHAEGWARHGWAVHFPAEDDEPAAGGEPPLRPPGDDDLGNLPAPVGDGEPGGGDGGEGAEPEVGEGGAPDFEAMTRAQIVDTTYRRYGVQLNPNQSRDRLIEQARQVSVDAAAALAEAAAGGEVEGSADADAQAEGVGAGAAADSAVAVVVPDLGL